MNAEHTAVAGSGFIVSCNDGSAQWTGPGGAAILEMAMLNTRVYMTVENVRIDLHFEPFQRSDAGMYSCTSGNEMATVTLGRCYKILLD